MTPTQKRLRYAVRAAFKELEACGFEATMDAGTGLLLNQQANEFGDFAAHNPDYAGRRIVLMFAPTRRSLREDEESGLSYLHWYAPSAYDICLALRRQGLKVTEPRSLADAILVSL